MKILFKIFGVLLILSGIISYFIPPEIRSGDWITGTLTILAFLMIFLLLPLICFIDLDIKQKNHKDIDHD